MGLNDTYNPHTIGTPCCPFSGGVQEFDYSSGHGQVAYRCKGCDGSGKQLGWFNYVTRTSGVQKKVTAAVNNV